MTDDKIGMRVLCDQPADADQPIDIVAVHGIGEHSDDSWCKNVGTKDNPQWINWLAEKSMLPTAAPQARIMRYGYQSQWFGEVAMRQKPCSYRRYCNQSQSQRYSRRKTSVHHWRVVG